MKKGYARVLAIAGSDSGGGAGIQADIKAISATGGYASTAITAVTVQNTLGVSAVHVIPADIVCAQIEAVIGDIGADAVKIGMLAWKRTVEAVASSLADFPNVVLDPVMVSTSGHRLLEPDAVEALVRGLAPRARLLTPNIPEAEEMTGEKVVSGRDLPRIAEMLSDRLSSAGGRAVSVLVKAGHLDEDPMRDCLYDAERGVAVEFASPRVRTVNTHGTGCTLSSAIASFLAQGFGLEEAVGKAKEYIAGALAAGAEYSIGRGCGPVDHFYGTRKK
ncbi:MAG: bifunctional hydroxymethylpyrimidine kinase/phosphomethylpyrimidine kinase [Bacteroidales bacterium]|nr:bifunctional hydroxymethylpyrimidine kinase/phosphomethylpyrimidine kinase [Bacteroidales bacterium]